MAKDSLRNVLLQINDRLGDHDQDRLRFFLGNDVPRRIRDDPSLCGTFCLMQCLFDQDKINEQNFTFLIDTFEQIHCFDAANLLKEHKKRIELNGLTQSVQSLSLLMPPSKSLLSQVIDDTEDDEGRISTPSINRVTNVGDNEIIFNGKNNRRNSTDVDIGNHATPFPSSTQTQLH